MLSWVSVPYRFHTCSIPVPDQKQVFSISTYSPCISVKTSKRQSSFHTLRIKYAIQTLRIRQHRNVHSGHVVLISSHIPAEFTYSRTRFQSSLMGPTQSISESSRACHVSQAYSPRSIATLNPKPYKTLNRMFLGCRKGPQNGNLSCKS